MLEWFLDRPEWLKDLWFVYVTFHDLIQWGILIIIGYTAWDQRKQKRELRDLALILQEELDHVHAELHGHMNEDASLHADLGQQGMNKGEQGE